MPSITVQTPFGPACLTAEEEKLVSLSWSVAEENDEGNDEEQESSVLTEAIAQLNAYFAGELRKFDIPLSPGGIGIQSTLAPIIQDIPYGSTITYERLAIAAYHSPINQVTRAVANNPLPVIVPCHRVVGTDRIGQYVGRGGVGTKMALLRLENPTINFAGMRMD